MEEIKDTQTSIKKFSQEELDNAVASAKKRWENKLQKDYVSLEQFNEVNDKLTKATMELQLPKIKEEFIKAGGIEKAFDGFIKMNPDAFTSKDLSKLLETSKKNQDYLFKPQQVNVTLGNTDGKVDTADKLGLANGSLLRTK